VCPRRAREELHCDSQKELDTYWEKLMTGGGKPMACGWLTDRFGLCWQGVPRNVEESADGV
jgi:predicted 3-demethylubiquinone-9 3-methyltransferase (glyoxalase superfamily)